LILADVIEHMPRAWSVLNDYVRMVKPGGWVVISVPNMRYLPALWVFTLRGDWPEQPLGIFDETHVQVMTHKRLARWCQSAGLSLEREYECYEWRPSRRRIFKLLNRLTLRFFKSLFNFEIQARYRVGDLRLSRRLDGISSLERPVGSATECAESPTKTFGGIRPVNPS
jgi:hypothetical protein